MARTRELSLSFVESHPGDAARVLEHLPTDDTSAFLKLLPVRLGAPVLRHMLPTSAARCLEQLDDETAAGLVRDLDAQTGSAVLRYVRQPRRDQLIAQLPTTAALAFRLLLTYPEDTVGAWINTHCLAVTPETPASEALERLRQSPESAGTYLYVVDADWRLKGMAAITDLLRAGRGTTVAQSMQSVRHRLSARASLAAAHQHQGWKEYHALPVLERQERFIGALEFTVLHRAIEQPHAEVTASTPADSLSLLTRSLWMVFANLLQALITLLPPTHPLAEDKHGEP
ncbi:MAG: CBS domain-containing protein [Gammaproteobacteria bacterium]|nr:CBS domain-containing protein [Gammaproteobacteria bacterium]MDH3370605.1 CBS domain-containing protein [Gammaproteobacteria bacterium]MDH3407473.1 CBS domain-containing protein [Gammaproteobacteria bacterium]MDH3561835.1 CBS domain-containing protein [Gammaproteobacteria bacterium]MDH5487309.1 CBS domain-containing protein [Gammaproteobacteria bacterium]